jgi:hypothetical protein
MDRRCLQRPSGDGDFLNPHLTPGHDRQPDARVEGAQAGFSRGLLRPLAFAQLLQLRLGQIELRPAISHHLDRLEVTDGAAQRLYLVAVGHGQSQAIAEAPRQVAVADQQV